MQKLKEKKFFLLDKDGTLSLGNKVLKGAEDFLNFLSKKNIKYAVATNNSSKTKYIHLKNLKNMGLNFQEDNIIVSLDVAISYLKKRNIKKLFWLANSEVSNYLNNFFKYDEKNPESILVTFDTELNYNKLLKIVNLLHKNIPYYITHSDIVCPTEKYDIPDVGTFVKLLEMTTGKLPDKDFGKPNHEYIKYIKEKYNVEEKDIVIIGDRLYTDIKLAQGNDITSILVLSGETKIDDYQKSDIKADFVLNSIKDVIDYMEGRK